MTAPVAGPLGPPLAGRTAAALLAAFLLLHVALALTAVPDPGWPSVLALVVTGVAAVVVVRAGTLPRGTTPVAVVATVTATAPLVLPLPPGGWPGYAAWPLGAWTFLALALALRGRLRTAWLVMATMTAVCVTWAVTTTGGPLPGFDLVVRQAGTLAVGSLFAIALERAADRVAALEEAERRRALVDARARAQDEERRGAAGAALALAGPALARIASGASGPADGAALLALEGRLRDGIMARPLLTDDLSGAAGAARLRGDDVVLLVDEAIDGAAEGVRAAAARFLADHLRRSRGPFTGRAVLHGDVLRVSARRGGSTEVLELPLSGPPSGDG